VTLFKRQVVVWHHRVIARNVVLMPMTRSSRVMTDFERVMTNFERVMTNFASGRDEFADGTSDGFADSTSIV
jgi:hypothetical protein